MTQSSIFCHIYGALKEYQGLKSFTKQSLKFETSTV